MSFKISDGIKKVANGLGIAEDNLLAEADRLAALYPDIEQFEAQLVAWMRLNVTAQLEPDKLLGTLAGIARDIWAGNAGTDPKAFGANV
jgi:hypothetical protein